MTSIFWLDHSYPGYARVQVEVVASNAGGQKVRLLSVS
jgi:hypothetical protein